MQISITIETIYCLAFFMHLIIVSDAGILPLTLWKVNVNTNAMISRNMEKLGYIEYQPNGTLILRSTMENGTNLQNLILFNSVMNAIRLTTPPMMGMKSDSATKFNIKIYGDGVEHRFPPFLERILQRIQSYFSIYKYPDSSRPVDVTTIASASVATTSTSGGYSVYDAGSGDNVDGSLNFTDDMQHANDDEYSEFIAIGEHDGYITVGKD